MKNIERRYLLAQYLMVLTDMAELKSKLLTSNHIGKLRTAKPHSALLGLTEGRHVTGCRMVPA